MAKSGDSWGYREDCTLPRVRRERKCPIWNVELIVVVFHVEHVVIALVYVQ